MVRFKLVTPRARTLLARTCGSEVTKLLIITNVSPCSSESIAGAPPLNGTCSIFVLVIAWNSSVPRCAGLPGPVVAYAIRFGLALPG